MQPPPDPILDAIVSTWHRAAEAEREAAVAKDQAEADALEQAWNFYAYHPRGERR